MKRVIVFSDFHDTLATEFYTNSGVEIVKLKMPDTQINYDLTKYTSARKTKKSR
jgi:dCMP deaminase